MITNLIQTNASINTNSTNLDNNNNNNNNNFDRLIVRLERNFHYLQNNAGRDRSNGTPLDLSELNNALIAGWERLALIRNQINENNENSNNNNNNNNNSNNNETENDNDMHVEIVENDGVENFHPFGPPQPELNRNHLPMPQYEYHDENLREYNEELLMGNVGGGGGGGGVGVQNYFREVGSLQRIEMNNRMAVQEMPALPMPPLLQPINNNNNLALEDHDDFEFVDSDSEDLINEETEDEDDASQGLISLSDLHVLELEGRDFEF